MRFEVSGKRYEFDPDPALLMGDELMLIEDHIGSTIAEWGSRLAAQRFGIRDILLIAFLAARRQGQTTGWAEFIATVAPLTFRVVDDLEAPAVSPTVAALDAIAPESDVV
jgi:hypothetical protein